MDGALLFLGVDGGGTQCRARLCDGSGTALGEGKAGPANTRLGLDNCMRSVLDATDQCLAEAKLNIDSRPNTPEEFRAFVKDEMERWGKVVKEAGIKLG